MLLLRPFHHVVGALGRLTGILRCLTLARRLEGHPRAPGLRETDGDRLVGRLGAVLAFADVVHLFTNELAGRRGRPLALAEVFLRALEGLLLWHGYLLGHRDSGLRPKALRTSPLGTLTRDSRRTSPPTSRTSTAPL